MRVVLERQSEAVTMGVRSLDPDLVLNTPVEDLVDRLYEKYRVEPVVLDLDHRRSSGATDVSLPFESWSGRTAEVEGTRVEVLLPFSGDGVLLDVRASTFDMNPPRFDVRGNTVAIVHEGRAPLHPEQVKASIDHVVSAIEQQLGWQQADIDPWNEQMRASLSTQVEARRAKVLQDRALDAFLEVPVVEWPNAATSFSVDPPARPRIVGVDVPGASRSFEPEPAISDQGLAAILGEIVSVTTAVERLPKTFVSMPEESLRDVLLVVLNNRFGPATGETFSRRGKTDIIIPWGGDERAVLPVGHRRAATERYKADRRLSPARRERRNWAHPGACPSATGARRGASAPPPALIGRSWRSPAAPVRSARVADTGETT